jgi:hypothetical protein
MISTPSAPTTRLAKSVVIVATITTAATPLPCRNLRFGRPYTMLNADSSALKSESDDQSSAIPPTTPSVAALSCTRWTSERMLLSDVVGNARLSSFTRKSDASARCTRPSKESARNVSGTNDRSAKYASIAARWVPRSAKNFATSARLRRRTSRSFAGVGRFL